jgi:hypothetical protein
MMEAARTSETSIDIQYSPHDFVTMHGLDDRAIGVRSPAGAEDFFL